MPMTEMHTRLLDRFYEKHLGGDWKRTAGPLHLDGWQVVEALWPMNEVFRPHYALLQTIAYSKDQEPQADRAIAAYVLGSRWSDDDPSPKVWRVLAERHTQTLMLALANDHAGNKRLMTVPDTLDKRHQLHAAMLFFQFQMKLPFPVQSADTLLWPEGQAPASLKRH